MAIEINLEGQKLDATLLFGIYRAYCQAFGIKESPKDQGYFFTRGVKTLDKEGKINYHPVAEAEFSVRIEDGRLNVSVKSQNKDPNQEAKESRLIEIIKNLT